MQDDMAGATDSVEEILADFPTPILPKIDGELTREGLINLIQLVRGNSVSVDLNLRGGRHGHLGMKITAEDYREHTGFAFVPSHNPDDYPNSMGYAQEQAPGTEKFQQNQALFCKYTAVD